jgi:UDP-3-O-[3-hydroxymyristoyl] N-acetylglucosamine deacetylase/3-hydroxyacyl-[acyl-carrier-protein] dehydratase
MPTSAIDGPECPILDGSSKPILAAIAAVGSRELEAEQGSASITENFHFTDEKSGASYIILPAEKTSYTVMIDYRSRVLPPQHAVLNDLSAFENEIASSRTFCFLHELEYLLGEAFDQRRKLDNAVVFVEEVLDESSIRNASPRCSINRMWQWRKLEF